MKRLLFSIFVLCLLLTQIQAQEFLINTASNLLAKGRYKDARSVVDAMKDEDRDGQAYLIRGIASYFLNDADGAISDLARAYKEEVRNPILFLYNARSYYAKGNYEDAALHYKLYLKGIPAEHKDVPFITNEIKRCAVNLRMSESLSIAYVENLGQAVNTEFDEVRPVNSPNYINKYYFSSNRDMSTGGPRDADGLKDDLYGTYAMDMYSVELVNGNWTPVFAFNSLQNTSKQEIIQGFNSDGSELYFLQGSKSEEGRLYTDPFAGDAQERAFPKEVASDFHGAIGDKDLFVFNDSIWIFASKRKGGYGGYDLYSMRKTDGAWQEAVNLGPDINSAYDDVSPFVSRGSKVLLFSSNRLEGYGGFDIFVTGYSKNIMGWEKVRNLGPPVNSPKDDLGIIVSGDGTQAVFYSDRLKGFGGFDIYLAYLKTQMIDQLEFTDVPVWMQTEVEGEENFAEVRDPFEDVPSPDNKDEEVPQEAARDYLNQGIQFTENGDDLNANAKYALNNLVNIMKIYPGIKVGLFSNTSSVGMPDFNLFYTAKRGERVAEYLSEQGIQQNRIFIFGKGDNFPMVKSSEPRLAGLNNNRVDIKIYDYDASKLRVVDDRPVIKAELTDERADIWNEAYNSLFYAVLIAETSQMLRTDLVKTRKDAFVIKSPGRENYQYYIGLFKTYGEARGFKNEMLRNNMLNATVVPFLYGRKMTEEQVSEKLSAFPDLAEYLKFEK